MNKVKERSSSGVKRKKRLWTEDEDKILVNYVKNKGEGNWTDIQRATGLFRSGKSCRLRWRDQLRPGLIKEPFTLDEEKLIANLHSQVGNKWSVIAEYLPGRTDNAIKNYWYNRTKRYKRVSLVQESPEWIFGSEISIKSESLSSDYLSESCDDDPFLLNSSSLPGDSTFEMVKPEGLELSSIQQVETPRGFMDKDEESVRYALSECSDWLVDPMLNCGDVVDNCLKLSGSDRSLNHERDSHEAMCRNDEVIGAATSIAECSGGSIVGPPILPDWLNSPGLDEFLDQEAFQQDTVIYASNNGTLDNVATTTEVVGEEVVYEGDGFVEEPTYWLNSPCNCMDHSIFYANDENIDNFSTTSCEPNYGWDFTFDFWSTPF